MRKVKNIIAGQVLETVRPGNPIMDALHRMETKTIHSLLVFDGDRFCGIVTMTDIAMSYHGQAGGTVEDIMTKADDIIYVSPDDNLYKCSTIVHDHLIHHLVVKDSNGKVCGVISSIDLMLSENEERENAAEIAREFPPN